MVNRKQRDVGARVLRDFIDGNITNDEFHARFPRNHDDPALDAVFVFAWGLYSDLHVHKLTGRYAPDQKAQAVLDRCILFLRGNLEFEWPIPTIGILNIFSNLWFVIRRWFGFGPRKKETPAFYGGDETVWPFFRRSDLEAVAGQCH